MAEFIIQDKELSLVQLTDEIKLDYFFQNQT